MNQIIKILVIEDEKHISGFITSVLTAQNYQVVTAATGKEGLSLATSLCPDLMLLDLGLPDMDGMEIISSIREWTNMPIIVISARTQENDKVRALDQGADDYITKPFGNSELLARIRTALRHGSHMLSDDDTPHSVYRSKGLVVDFEKYQVTRDGQEIHLTQNEFKILSMLAHNSGKVMTYDRLIEHIWGPYSENDNTILRVNMANIRRKIEPNPAEPVYIFTEIGVGYRMAEEDQA